MTRRARLGIPVIALLLLFGAPSIAQPDERTREAREAFQEGKQAFLEGRCEDAIRFYQQAMKLKPSAKLHYNIGLAYEKLDQPAKALAAYRAYLKGEPAAANAEEVRQRIENLEKRPAGPAAPVPVVMPRQPPPAPAPGQPTPPTPRTPAAPAVGPALAPGWTPQAAYTSVVAFRSTPPGAGIFIDGRLLGVTPQNLAMVYGASYQLELRKPGFISASNTIVAHPGQLVTYDLQPTAEGRVQLMTRTEWFAFAPEIGSQAANVAFVLRLMAFGLRWRHLFWTIADAGLGAGADAVFCADISTRAGYPLYFGARGQHQLRGSLGVGFGLVRREIGFEDVDQVGLVLSPTLEYRFQSAARFFIGVSVRYATIVAGSLRDIDRAHAVLVGVPMGWAARE